MHRRVFLSLPLVVSTIACAAKEDLWGVIESVQEQLFPDHGKFPSAKSFQAIRYLKMVSYHDSFDKDDLAFLKEGAKVLIKRGYRSIMIEKEKEKILHTFSQTRFGENWLSLMINYTLEAMLSDPLYGGNKGAIGWKAYHHHAGLPRPIKPYGVKHG